MRQKVVKLLSNKYITSFKYLIYKNLFEELKQLLILSSSKLDEIKDQELKALIDLEILKHESSVTQSKVEFLNQQLDDMKQTLHMLTRQQKISNKPITCLFLIHNQHIWDAVANVYLLMKSSNFFRPFVASINHRLPGENTFFGEQEIHQFLDSIDVEHFRFSMSNSFEALEIIKAINPTFIFRQSPWDTDIHPAFSSKQLNFSKLCYIPYYALQVTVGHNNTKSERDHHTDSDFHRFCSLIFCDHGFTQKAYQEQSLLQASNVKVVGNSKLFRLYQIANQLPSWPIVRESICKDIFRIVWAPHHSVGFDWLNFGAFKDVAEQLLKMAKEDESIEIVMKPHPLLMDMVKNNEISKLECSFNYRDFFERWEQQDNTAISVDGDYSSLFSASDLLITDGISFLTEYQLFQKPIVFFERSDHVPFNELGKEIVKGVNSFNTAHDVIAFIYQFRSDFLDPKKDYQLINIHNFVPKVAPEIQILEELSAAVKM